MRRRIDERSPDAATPKVRFDEQAIELAANHCRKARDLSAKLGHGDLTVGDLRGRQVDGLGIGQELCTIVGQLKRCPALQIFECLLLLGPGEPESEKVSVI